MVFQARRGDVHTVVVNGRVVKHNHRLIGVDLAKARQAAAQTVDYLQGELGPEAWTEGDAPGGPGDPGGAQPVHLHLHRGRPGRVARADGCRTEGDERLAAPLLAGRGIIA